MAGTVYTRTFLKHTGVNQWWYWTVPAGHVAVITSCAATNGANAAGGVAYVYADDVALWFGRFLESYTNAVVSLRAQIDAGERVGMYLQGQEMTAWVTGYLFRTSGAAAVLERRDEPEPGDPPTGWIPAELAQPR